MDKPTSEEIEAAVRRGCRGLPEAVVRLCVDEVLGELGCVFEIKGSRPKSWDG